MFSLNYRDTRPIYEQVRDGLRHLVVTGALSEGERLPPVRTLASRLAINPMTIRRAYAELEAEGYVVQRAEDETIVSPNGTGQRKAELLERFDAITIELVFLGMSVRELVERVSRVAALGGDAPTAAPLAQEGGDKE